MTSERTGGAVIDLLQCCDGCVVVSFSGSKVMDW